MKRIELALITAVAATGCLQKDTTSTMFLRQDGSLDWVVSEDNVRSNEGDSATGTAEESDYLDAVVRDEPDVAKSFRELGGINVRTRLLRDTRPYAVRVDGRFSGLSDLVDRALTSCGVPHHVDLSTHDGVATWRLWADVDEDGENAALGESDECTRLIQLSDWDAFSIRLESGRFTDAIGFTIQGDDAVIIDEDAMKSANRKGNPGGLVMSLSWTSRAPNS